MEYICTFALVCRCGAFFVQYYRRQHNRAKVLAEAGCEMAGRVGRLLIVCEAAQLRHPPTGGQVYGLGVASVVVGR